MTADPNTLACERMIASHPWLVGVRSASEVVPGMHAGLILHAAPPVPWSGMSELMRGGMIGAALAEGLARTPHEAAAKAERGEIVFGAAQDHGATAGGVGAITAGTPVMVVEDRSNGNRSAHFLMEGLGRTLVSGAYDETVLERLAWFREMLGPMLDGAIRALGGIDLRAIMAEALTRGDELHNRNRAASSIFLNKIALGLLQASPAPEQHRRILQFLDGNAQFFVSAALPAAELMLRAAHGIPGASVLTAVGGNGVDCGIKVSGLGGRWLTAPGDVPKGILLEGFGPADVAPGCGDSFLIECAGLGASVLPAAPAFAPAIGASLDDARAFAANAYRLALGEHPHYRIPALGFRGAPVGVDVRKVVETRALPLIDIMMCHRTPGIGLVGMGLVSPPMQCFEDAVRLLDDRSR
jgi:Protein of unknown function (DUF1116)